MKILAVAVFGAIVAAPAYADWNFTRWGMSPAEVVQASSGSVHPFDNGQMTSDGQKIMAEGEIHSGDLDLQMRFLFSKDGLSSLNASLPLTQCDALTTALKGRYGEGTPTSAYWMEWVASQDNFPIKRIFFPAVNQCVVFYSPLRTRNGQGL